MSRNHNLNRKNRTFHMESLERRELMSATPWQTSAEGIDVRQAAAVAPMTPGQNTSSAPVQLRSAGQTAAMTNAWPYSAIVEGGVLKIQALETGYCVTVRPYDKSNELIVHATLLNHAGPDYQQSFQLNTVTKIEYNGTDFNDGFENGTKLASIAHGGKGGDYFSGGSARDVFYGGDHDDTMYGNAGEDELFGDGGDDKLWGGNEKDVLHGGADKDYVNGGAGDDDLFGDEGADRFKGEEGADRLYFEAGIDVVENPDPLDWIISPSYLKLEPGSISKVEGAAGAKTTYEFRVTRTGDVNTEITVDYIVAGTGSSKADSADFVDGKLPKGKLIFAKGETTKLIKVEVTGDATVEHDEKFIVTLLNATGGATITAASATGTITNDDKLPSWLVEGQPGIFEVTSTNGDDNVVVTQKGGVVTITRNGATASLGIVVNRIIFNGGIGNDRFENKTKIASTVNGGIGNDTLIGGGGSDELYGEDGIDTLQGGAGNDYLYGGNHVDHLDGGDNDDHLEGGDGDDGMYGGDGRDFLFGQKGNDWLYGGLGDDTLYGEIGKDHLDGQEDADTLYGKKGKDHLRSRDGIVGNDKLYGGPKDVFDAPKKEIKKKK